MKILEHGTITLKECGTDDGKFDLDIYNWRVNLEEDETLYDFLNCIGRKMRRTAEMLEAYGKPN